MSVTINKQTKYTYIKIEFQNSIERLSFLCRITDIKIAWINPCKSYFYCDIIAKLNCLNLDLHEPK